MLILTNVIISKNILEKISTIKDLAKKLEFHTLKILEKQYLIFFIILYFFSTDNTNLVILKDLSLAFKIHEMLVITHIQNTKKSINIQPIKINKILNSNLFTK